MKKMTRCVTGDAQVCNVWMNCEAAEWQQGKQTRERNEHIGTDCLAPLGSFFAAVSFISLHTMTLEEQRTR
jgi:hypothetical protein